MGPLLRTLVATPPILLYGKVVELGELFVKVTTLGREAIPKTLSIVDGPREVNPLERVHVTLTILHPSTQP